MNTSQEKSQDDENSVEELADWTHWGINTTIEFLLRYSKGLEDSFQNLTSKAHQSITINAILIGLVANALATEVNGTIALLTLTQNALLCLGLAFLSLFVSLFASICVILPKRTFISEPSEETIAKFRFKADTEIGDQILTQLQEEMKNNKWSDEMARWVRISWSALAVEVFIVGLALIAAHPNIF